MLLVLPEFDILATDTVEETCSLLHRYAGDARILAGGTDLLVKMKQRRVMPRQLINIKRIPNLDQIRYGEDLRIGALATIQLIKDSAVIAKACPMLAQAAGRVGTLHIRHLGTIGGNLANASPSAEFAPALLTLGASVKCVGPGGERTVPVENFFVGPGKSVLAEDEVVTEVQVPDLPPGGAGVYLKHSLRRMDVAIAAAAVVVCLDGDVCREARIALGAVGPTPFRAHKAEAALAGQKLLNGASQNELFDAIAEIASDESLPIDDIRSYAGYRRKVIFSLVREALDQVTARTRA